MGSSNEINVVRNDYLKQNYIKDCPESFPISALPTVQIQSQKCICKIFLKTSTLFAQIS